MNAKQLLLLTTLTCTIPGVTFAADCPVESRDSCYDSCDVCESRWTQCGEPRYELTPLGEALLPDEDNPAVATKEQLVAVFGDPEDTTLHPVAVTQIDHTTYKTDILRRILSNNKNVTLRAVAARTLAQICDDKLLRSKRPFSYNIGRIAVFKRYNKKAYDLLLTLEQTPEVIDILDDIECDLYRWHSYGAKTVEEFQLLIDMTTDLGLKVGPTAKVLHHQLIAAPFCNYWDGTGDCNCLDDLYHWDYCDEYECFCGKCPSTCD